MVDARNEYESKRNKLNDYLTLMFVSLVTLTLGVVICICVCI